MAATPTEPDHPVTMRTLNLTAEVKKAWGPKWNAPEVAYEFSNGRKFYMRTEDAYIDSDFGEL